MASGNYVLIELKNRNADQYLYQAAKADCLKKKANCDELVQWRINEKMKRRTVTVLLFDNDEVKLNEVANLLNGGYDKDAAIKTDVSRQTN